MKKVLLFFVLFVLFSSNLCANQYYSLHRKNPRAFGILPSMKELSHPIKYEKTFAYSSKNQPQIVLNFEGLDNPNNVPNPDTQGDVGPNHYVQIVKSSFGIWDKQGNVLAGPIDNSQIWTAIPGPWNNEVHTDPIVLYDGIEDRWLITSMVYDIPTVYWELIALSQTPAPTQGWYCWAYEFDVMPDYPKFGVWDDAYYMTINDFYIDASYNSTFEGQTVMAFNKEDMITGISDPDNVLFHFDPVRDEFYLSLSNLLPMNLDGPMPDHDVPYFLVCVKDNAWGFNTDHLQIWQCDVDWDHTASSTMTLFQEIEVDSFDTITPNMNYVHQPGTGTRIFSMNDRLMFPLQYRHIDGKDILMANHTINMGNDIAAVRWYELNRVDSLWTIHQQNTYNPPDGLSRWMGSIAMDKYKNIALGYSISGDAVYPSIRVTGRKNSDPLNELTVDEIEIVTGGGNQMTNTRWGDYSMMSVDPVDDLIFWYTQMYLPVSGAFAWSTRITSFMINTEISVLPDQLVFETIDDCINGKETILFNLSWDDILIDNIPQSGIFPGTDVTWFIEPWTIQLPYLLETMNTLPLKIKIDPGTTEMGYVVTEIPILAELKDYTITLQVQDSLVSNDPAMEFFNEISIFPNPFQLNKDSQNYLNISFNTIDNDNIFFSLFNIKGQLINSQSYNIESSGDHQISIPLDLMTLKPGMYFLHCTPDHAPAIFKKCIIF
ncbi:MAG: T9SS type A sorting domain-containing protein [Candidatus Cloacimonetes bacterium]|nr:T9SS type A sorting domain-containing protein [Candidatus Cloacimonadota bacterium]